MALAVALLAGAAGTGIWLLARDDGDGASHYPGGSSGTGAASDPCAAVDVALAKEWGLDSGRPDNPTDPNAGLTSCQWGYYGSNTSATAVFHLIYAKGPVPMSPSPTPIAVTGVPSATASENDTACAVQWPTSFGKAIVHVARSGEGLPGDLCSLAAGFAGAVAPRVPG
ncbi:DUF3558 domain-containing protein [Streptomyces sp. NPDC101227]|uniref:DUF3558 domain-containing protein n=1 Tax=Streptomyces sp. NPDC101227 TaxID=3366136 RepID=UPI00382C39BD